MKLLVGNMEFVDIQKGGNVSGACIIHRLSYIFEAEDRFEDELIDLAEKIIRKKPEMSYVIPAWYHGEVLYSSGGLNV